MIRIKLFCSMGMSTSMLMSKMKQSAKSRGIDAQISCSPVTTLDNDIDVDVVFIGPQIIFQLDKVKAICEPKNIPVAVIDMVDYGMLNGEKVMNEALELYKNKER